MNVNTINSTTSIENNEKISKEKTNTLNKNKCIKNNLIKYSNKKILNLIPLKNISDLFINYNIVKIDENGLCDNVKKSHNNKVIFNISQDNNSPSNGRYTTSTNNNESDKTVTNQNDKENNTNYEPNNIDTVFVNNKIESTIDKTLSLFSIQYNNLLDKYILTSLVDDIFFALEIGSNKNFYLDDSKRYYIQLSEIIISVLPNNNDKNITIKILNLNKDESKHEKYVFNMEQLPIKIGRNGCNININKKSISKVHLTINYDNNKNQFFVMDNCSTNGSLILLKKGKDVKLEDKMFFFLGKEHFILKI